jgi:hypothetical protein
VTLSEKAAAVDGMLQALFGIKKLRVLLAVSSGPPNGPFAFLVSATRHGVTGTNCKAVEPTAIAGHVASVESKTIFASLQKVISAPQGDFTRVHRPLPSVIQEIGVMDLLGLVMSFSGQKEGLSWGLYRYRALRADERRFNDLALVGTRWTFGRTGSSPVVPADRFYKRIFPSTPPVELYKLAPQRSQRGMNWSRFFFSVQAGLCPSSQQRNFTIVSQRAYRASCVQQAPSAYGVNTQIQVVDSWQCNLAERVVANAVKSVIASPIMQMPNRLRQCQARG